MRVHIDDQIFLSQAYGGISRYFFKLMEAFSSDPSLGVDLATPRIWTRNHDLLASGMGRSLPPPLSSSPALMGALNRRLGHNDADEVVHATYYNAPYLARFQAAPVSAVTIVDMIPERFPELFPGGNPHLAKRDFVEAADLVFCISQATQEDLIRCYGKPSAPLVVTHLGVDEVFTPDVAALSALPENYVLYVGGRWTYKDFGVLARAFAQSDLAPEIKLVVIGGGRVRRDENRLLKELGILDRTVFASLSHEELPAAYAHALTFVYPSRSEGFGIPTLEAMASGCPVILSSAPVHREVASDAAVYFSSENSDQLALCLDQVVSDSALQKRMREKGLQQASRFSWQETARRTRDAYRQALRLSP